MSIQDKWQYLLENAKAEAVIRFVQSKLEKVKGAAGQAANA
ncbi:hypothetical protein [Paenibacillus alba]|uniref:Uncharacterized protein n=1 Tax=Paenibacillus alba TaxID=1197127 RepID=A0ABU6GAT7_9BACL|nr:hypothetical protein [Paenibacillus alba]MEC0231251.1 hypothetical protein [Paenibacillus alba]